MNESDRDCSPLRDLFLGCLILDLVSLEYGDSFVHLNEQDNWCHIIERTNFNHNMVGGILRDEMVNFFKLNKKVD